MDGGADTPKNEHTTEFLKELQAMPMEAKVLLTQARIDEFYTGYNTIGYGNAYVSFSGGKDSTVLLDIARKRYPDIPAVFSNTGLEYYEIQRFARSKDNVEVVTPKMRFDEVISTYGYPLIGKEVAEAIYYARRICSQPVQVERERERAEREPHCVEPMRHEANDVERCVPVTHTHTHNAPPPRRTAWQTRRRWELNGNLSLNEQRNRDRRTGVASHIGNELRLQSNIRESETPPG